MRPKFSVCSDYGAPAQKPKILLAAIAVVASVVGISGIYRQVIEPEWVQHSPTHQPKMSLPTSTIERSAIVAAIPLPPPRAVTTGEATISYPRLAPAPELSQPRTTVVAVKPPARTETPLGISESPEAQAKAEALPPESASVVAANLAEKSRAGVVVKKAVVVKKKVVHVGHHHHGYSGAYAQNGGWGWPGGGWTGFSPFGNFRRF
jgi:hypothetical protein